MTKIYEFREHSFAVSGEKNDLLLLAEFLRSAESTLGDLRYQIEYAFDVDGVRSDNNEDEDSADPDFADRYLKKQA